MGDPRLTGNWDTGRKGRDRPLTSSCAVADEYPGEPEVTGIDLSPIQPTWVPPNVRFYVDDAESEWDERDDSIDLYTHDISAWQ